MKIEYNGYRQSENGGVYMNLSYAYLSANIISITMILITLGVVYKKNSAKGAKNLMLVLTLILIGTFSIFMEKSVQSFELKHLWRNISQIGLFILPSSIFAFTMVYTEEERPIFKHLMFLNFLFSVTAVLLIYTNNFHHIMRVGVALVESSSGPMLKVYQTTIGKVSVAINTMISVSALIKIWIFMRTRSKSMKAQVRLVFIGFLIPIVYTYAKSAVLKYIGISIPASTSFLIGIVFILWGLYKYDLMAISPIARDWVIDEIKLGMLFFDSDCNVVDTNKSAREIFGVGNKQITEKIKAYPRWKQKLNNKEDTTIELGIDTALRGHRIYGITIHILKDKKKSLGVVALLRDITKEVHEREKLIDKSEKDSMTQIYNRLTFEKKVNEILSGNSENSDDNLDFSLLVIDIDNFKDVNDTYGHKMGDDVIIEVVKLTTSISREHDIVGRLGGDEFAVFLQNCDVALNEKIAKRIQTSVNNYDFIVDEMVFNVSLSIGGITDNSGIYHFDDLYIKADSALYDSKETGRKKFTQYRD